MQATAGDHLHVHGRSVGVVDHVIEIVEVRGPNGTPPYVVRHPDGHETLMYPGPDTTVERTSGQRSQHW